MIYTVTCNPSLDYIVSVEDFRLGRTNRTASEQIQPGGKGINVSIVLNRLGIPNTAIGFTAGFVGEEIEKRVEEAGCKAEFIRMGQGNSRINLKLKSVDGTEINGQGPEITEEAMEQLFYKLDRMREGDWLVLAGSIPASLPDCIYCDMMRHVSQKRIEVVVDATQDLLLQVLRYRPFLIKPNNHELGEVFQTTIRTREEAFPYAQRLQQMGARNVLVSMGGEGAVLIAENGEAYEQQAVHGKLVNAVGAGDSMVAGFLAGWIEQKNYAHAFRMGLSAGSATAFSEFLAEREEVEAVYRTLQS